MRPADELEPIELAYSFAKSSKVYPFKEMLSQRALGCALNFYTHNRKPLKQKNRELLNHSTILAIWTLIPQIINDKIIESEIIGLARDNRINELYHWCTDLGQDVSVLMKYKPSK